MIADTQTQLAGLKLLQKLYPFSRYDSLIFFQKKCLPGNRGQRKEKNGFQPWCSFYQSRSSSDFWLCLFNYYLPLLDPRELITLGEFRYNQAMAKYYLFCLFRGNPAKNPTTQSNHITFNRFTLLQGIHNKKRISYGILP